MGLLTPWQATIQTDAGAAVASASVTVRRTSAGSPLAVIYSDAEATVQDNPRTLGASDDGFFQAWLRPGEYTIEAESGGESQTWTVRTGVDRTINYDARTSFVADVDAGHFDYALGGAVVTAGGFDYLLMPSGHALYGTDPISDLPGWVWLGDDPRPQHFGAPTETQADAEAGVSTMTDATSAVNAWLANTTGDLDFGPYWYRVTAELYNKVKGRTVKGAGRGYVSGDRDLGYQGLVGALTALVVDRGDTITPRRRTRREAPETSGDTDDSPISVMIDNQGEACQFVDFALVLDCDLTNTSHTNLGADVDVGFFNGCRGAVFARLSTLGYFRVAAEYWDVTGSPQDAMTAPDGSAYPEYDIYGADRCRTEPYIFGGYKGVFLAGAKESASGDYYDYVSDTVVSTQGGRGGSGASDFTLIGQWNIIGPEHHSGRRLYDPTMDVSTEDTDDLAGAIVLDGRRGSSTQKRIRRIVAKNGRIRTNEAVRIWIDRAAEVDFRRVHTEPSSGTWANTSGTTISIGDYSSHGYGPLAMRPTSGDDTGALDITAFRFEGTGPISSWTKPGVPTFDYTDNYGDVETGTFTPVLQFGTDITYTDQTGIYRRQGDQVWLDISITWSALDDTDVSDIFVGGLPFDRAPDSPVTGAIDFGESDGLDMTGANGFFVAGIDGLTSGDANSRRLRFEDVNGVPIDYNDGQIQTTGTLRFSAYYRTDEDVL